MKISRLIIIQILASIVLFAHSAFGQTTAFTYQGSLKDGASPANGNYDFEFKLFNLASGGAQQGSTVQRLNVAVANGTFSVSLDFGAAVLPGDYRFLEIGLRVNGNPGGFQQLLPRQMIGSSPYSIKSLSSENANSATNATQLGGVAANQFVQTGDSRLSDARNPLAGSANYIQNQNAGAQAATNFNISGNGTVGGTLSGGVVNAATQYNIGGNRVLSTAGTSNVFAGVGAGAMNTSIANSFFGHFAGHSNTDGFDNSFFGDSAGAANTTATNNSFFGTRAGGDNTIGSGNSFFGWEAGLINTEGVGNSFFGRSAGSDNTTGHFNSSFGRLSGSNNQTGSYNTFIGFNANVSFLAVDLSFATAIGSGSVASLSNSIYLGVPPAKRRFAFLAMST